MLAACRRVPGRMAERRRLERGAPAAIGCAPGVQDQVPEPGTDIRLARFYNEFTGTLRPKVNRVGIREATEAYDAARETASR